MYWSLEFQQMKSHSVEMLLCAVIIIIIIIIIIINKITDTNMSHHITQTLAHSFAHLLI